LLSRRGHRDPQATLGLDTGGLLPGLIKELAIHAHQGGQKDRERAFRLLADAYTAVDSMAYKWTCAAACPSSCASSPHAWACPDRNRPAFHDL
jgi:hypothetical protein